MSRGAVFYKILGQFWIVVPCTIFVISYGIYNREFPGLDPANATIYLVAGLLIIPSYIQAPRTYALSELRRYGASEMPVFSRKYTYKRDGSNFTWAGTDEKCYRIAFSASEQGTKNGQEVLKVMKSKPWIIWLQPGVWLAIYTVILVLNIFLDNIFVIVRDNILYECAVELANEIEADLTAKADSSMKCYRKVCPNCGAVSTSSLKHCNSCGTSLEVLDSTMGLGTLKFYRDDD